MTEENTPQEPEVVDQIKRPVPDYPLSLCLIGAPGSGKSEVASAFYDLAKNWFIEQGSELRVINNPGNWISRELDQAMGWAGGYREHLWTLFTRLTDEQEARASKKSFVSTGTMIENIAHAGIEFENVALGVQSSGLVTPQTETEMQKIQATMATMTYLMLDGFRYNFAFYLPLGERIILPQQGEESIDERHAKRVDNAIRAIFENFNLGIQALEGTVEEKAQTMFDTVKDIMEAGFVLTPVLAVEEPEPEGEINEFGASMTPDLDRIDAERREQSEGLMMASPEDPDNP